MGLGLLGVLPLDAGVPRLGAVGSARQQSWVGVEQVLAGVDYCVGELAPRARKGSPRSL